MKKSVLGFLMSFIVISTLFTSCATIFGKSSYPVSINSNPVGATVSITDKKSKEVFKGQTPATVTLKSGAGYFSKAEYQVKLTAEGFAEQIIPINFKLNGWYFGNILVGGVLGMLIVDPATGAMWKLDTPPLNITMNKSAATSSIPTLKIIEISSVPQDMKEYLVRIK